MRIYYYSIIIFFWLINNICKGQDALFSQYELNPSTTNTALYANNSNVNFSIANRRQWGTIADPINGFQIYGSCPFVTHNNKRWGASGISLSHLSSGEFAMFSTYSFNAFLAFNFRVHKSNYISMGGEASYIQHRMSPGSYTTGTQWSNSNSSGNANLTVSNGEPFATTVAAYPSYSGGILYYNQDETGRMKHFAGLSMHHLNSPDESTYAGFISRLPIRYTFISGYTVYESDNFYFTPNSLLAFQSTATYIMAGTTAGAKLAILGERFEKSRIALSAYYRINDAAVFSLQLHQRKYTIAFNYDHTTSTLPSNLYATGATEVQFIYRIPVVRQPKPEKIKEPKFKERKVKERLAENDTEIKKDTTDIESAEKSEPSQEENIIPSFVTLSIFNNNDSTAINARFFLKEIDPETGEATDSTMLEDELHRLHLILPQGKQFEIIALLEGYSPQPIAIPTDKDSIDKTIYLTPARKEKQFDRIANNKRETRISAYERRKLQLLILDLKYNPEKNIEIRSYTDHKGGKRKNQRISEERAKNIASFLCENGIIPDRIGYKGYGESHPLIKGRNKKARFRNNRTEIEITFTEE
ncbi:MAG: PorP/SprF family type IX secretion system membrane protein [Cytophagaceae bacterium]